MSRAIAYAAVEFPCQLQSETLQLGGLKLDTTGTITSFTSTPNSVFNIGGDAYRVETAGQSYSLTTPDAQTLRFEIRPGDQWT